MSVLNIGAGYYYGDGTYGSSTSTGSYRNDTVSLSDIRRMSKNTAAGYSQQFEMIQAYMENGQVDKALKKYDSIFEEVKASNTAGGEILNDSQTASIMSNAYAYATGSSLMTQVSDKTSSPIWSGLVQGLPIIGMFCEDMTTAEAMAKMEGEKPTFGEKLQEYAGAAASGAAAGAALGLVTFGPIVGAIGGAIWGAGQVLLKDMF